MAENVTVSIVTYNSKHIEETLKSLIENVLPFFSVKVAIFDNNSRPDYQALLRSYESDKISVHYSKHNSGFGHGHNYNLAHTIDPYFVVCNPDILLSRDSFQIMLDFLEEHKDASMVTPKIVNTNGTTQYLIRERLDVFDYMLRFVPFRWVKQLFSKRLARYEMRDLPDRIQTIKFGSGALMFLKTSMMKKINGFDERFFMYFEDNDLCMRINLAGGKIYYVPEATVTHYYGAEAHKSYKVFKIFIRSMVQYFNKWGWQFF